MMSVVILNAVVPSVVAPFNGSMATQWRQKSFFEKKNLAAKTKKRKN
jgi:hypothetical protein